MAKQVGASIVDELAAKGEALLKSSLSSGAEATAPGAWPSAAPLQLEESLQQQWDELGADLEDPVCVTSHLTPGCPRITQMITQRSHA